MMNQFRKWQRFLSYLLLALAIAFILDYGLLVKAQPQSPTQLMESARQAYHLQNYQAAIAKLERAREYYQSQGNKLQEAVALNNLALSYQHLQNSQKAQAYLESSLGLIDRLPNSSQKSALLAQAKDISGKLALTQGRWQAAWETWQEAIDLYQAIGNSNGVLRSKINQAQALQSMGYYRRAVTELQDLNSKLDSEDTAKTTSFYSLGNALFAVGELDSAETNFTQSLEIAVKLNNSEMVSKSLLSLGNIAKARNEPEKAIALYQQAAIDAPDTVSKLQPQLNILSLPVSQQQHSNISADIDKLLPQLPLTSQAIQARINYASNLLRASDNSSKISSILANAIADARKMQDRYSTAQGLVTLGSLYESQQQLLTAQEVTEEGLTLAHQLSAAEIIYRGQWQLGRLLVAQNQLESAIPAYQLAVATLQDLRSDLIAMNPEIQFAFRESIEPIYRQYVGLLLEEADTPEANLIAAREAIDSLQLAELENFFRATCLDAQPVVLDTVIDRNDPTAAIVYPIVLGDRFEIILKLPQQKLKHYSTPIENPERTARMLDRLSESLMQRNSSQTLPLAQQVYDWLLRPMEKDLSQSDIKTLVFVLDSPLRNIPMAVLHDGERYLVEKYGIAITPGLQLIQPRAIASTKLNALTAGVTEARGGFPPLQYVTRELNTIQSQIDDTQQLIDGSFTRDSLSQAIASVPFSVVHLATHGQFSSNIEETFILTWEDRINVNQLASLLANTSDPEAAIELLVLSACETLTGDKRAALGLAGVAVRAGARSTLATLWRVNDEATSSVMNGFYSGLASTESKAEALRQAQLTLIKSDRFNHPHFWASYVLVGNWL